MSSDVHDEPSPTPALPTIESFRAMPSRCRDNAYLAVEREMRRLAALQAAMLHEVTASLTYLDDAHRSPAAWVQASTNCLRGTTARRVQIAVMLAANPIIAAANNAGLIGVDQLRLLADMHANPRARDQLPGSQELLVEHAKTLTAYDFRIACQRWLAHADPDGAHRDQEASFANRKASFSDDGSAGFRFVAEGDNLTGDALRRALEAQMQLEWARDIAERAARYGAEAAKYPLARTHAQRAHDAWANLMMKGAGVDTAFTREPIVTIVCTTDVLVRAILDFVGGPDAERITRRVRDGGGPSSSRSYLCETVSGEQVDPRDLAIAALLGQVQRVIEDSTGRIIAHGRKQRLFRGAARDAVWLMGNRWCWPGCDLRTGLQVDHMSPWKVLLGATEPANGAPLCGKHNRAKHTRSIVVTRDAAGWHFFRPHGTEIGPRS